MPASVVDIHIVHGKRPAFDVYIGRNVRYQTQWENTKWGNRFHEKLDLYEQFVRETLMDDLHELEGKRLGCWCITTDQLEPVRCHGQILLKLLKEQEVK